MATGQWLCALWTVLFNKIMLLILCKMIHNLLKSHLLQTKKKYEYHSVPWPHIICWSHFELKYDVVSKNMSQLSLWNFIIAGSKIQFVTTYKIQGSLSMKPQFSIYRIPITKIRQWRYLISSLYNEDSCVICVIVSCWKKGNIVELLYMFFIDPKSTMKCLHTHWSHTRCKGHLISALK